MPAMDGTARDGVTKLLAHLRALPPAQLVPCLIELTRAELAALAEFLPRDCRCPLRVMGCRSDCEPEACDCAAIPEPCPHIVEAQARDWPLPPLAIAYLLWKANPKEFEEPASLPAASPNTNPRAQVAVFAERRRRRQKLRHPLDWCRTTFADDRLARQPVRLRNGADAMGPLLLEGSQEDTRDE